MGAKTFADFQAAFPELYSNVRCGFSCPEGWLELVWKLSEDLARLPVKCDQVKEKFGGLRYYLANWTEEAQWRVDVAETASLGVCQECGERGKLRQHGHWLATECDAHFADFEERRAARWAKAEAKE